MQAMTQSQTPPSSPDAPVPLDAILPTPALVPAPPNVAAVRAALAHARSKVALLVDTRAAGNPVLRHVRHVRKEVTRGLHADFVCGPTTCALYLSLQYHALHPNYIYDRVRELARSFRLRVLIAVSDVPSPAPALRELASLALLANITLLVARDDREAARYIETLRAHDGRADAADILRAKQDEETDMAGRVAAALAAVRAVSKADAAALVYNIGSFRAIAQAEPQRLRAVPGLGDVKVARLHAALHMPFKAGRQSAIVDERDHAPEVRQSIPDA